MRNIVLIFCLVMQFASLPGCKRAYPQEILEAFEEESLPTHREEMRKQRKNYSTRTYAESLVVTVPDFSSWDTSTYSEDTSYLASTDGFVASWQEQDPDSEINGYTDGSNPPTTLIAKNRTKGVAGNSMASYIFFSVKNGAYWKVAKAGGAASIVVYWMAWE